MRLVVGKSGLLTRQMHSDSKRRRSLVGLGFAAGDSRLSEEEEVGDIMSKDEALSILKEMAKPFDLHDLVSKGVLKHSGAWYTILKPDELPCHVMRHVSSVQETSKGEVRFKFHKDWKGQPSAWTRGSLGRPCPNEPDLPTSTWTRAREGRRRWRPFRGGELRRYATKDKVAEVEGKA